MRRQSSYLQPVNRSRCRCSHEPVNRQEEPSFMVSWKLCFKLCVHRRKISPSFKYRACATVYNTTAWSTPLYTVNCNCMPSCIQSPARYTAEPHQHQHCTSADTVRHKRQASIRDVPRVPKERRPPSLQYAWWSAHLRSRKSHRGKETTVRDLHFTTAQTPFLPQEKLIDSHFHFKERRFEKVHNF